MGTLGHPGKFHRVSRLGSVTARHSSSGREPNFAALNRRHHLHSAGQPSRCALAHITVVFSSFPYFSVFFMVALCNRETIYIFMLWFVLLLLLSSFFPRLISAAADWMSAILPHMVWP